MTNKFGALVPIYGTLITSLIAMVVGIPISFGVAIFITELCPPLLKRPLAIAIELLAGIPSIIYGIWGLFVFAPFLQQYVQPVLINTLGEVPVVGALFAGPPFGIGILTAGLILAIMVLPFISSIMRDVFETVPPMLRESAYGLGCTTWEVVWHVVLPYTQVGVVGGIMLGLGRALGETMAVTFVIGNAHRITTSLMAPGTTISAALANEFTEAVGRYLPIVADRARPDPVRHHLHRAGDGEIHADPPAASGGELSHGQGSRTLRRPPAQELGHPGTVAVRDRHRAVLPGRHPVRAADRGASAAIRPSLFTEMTPPPGSDGGLLNAIFGSAIMTLVGTVVGTPIGILVGTYLAEYGRGNKLGQVIRFINDILLSAPSIIIGLFVYELMVVPMGHFSGWAGATALAIIVVPVVVRTTDDMLILVPNALREAAAALGTPKWKITVSVCYRAARQGMLTGVLLAVARISGETAPLLFTALSTTSSGAPT